MRGKITRGYVLKVAVASASIGCAMTACDSPHPVGSIAVPPQTITADTSDAGATAAPPPPTPTPVKMGTVALAPDAPDAAATTAPVRTALVPAAPPQPNPSAHKVGMMPRPPDNFSPVVGTTARAPDAKKP